MKIKYQIIYWRDIPAQVKAKAGRERSGQALSHRFTVAIDEAAMQAGKTESDDYLAEWRNGGWQERDGEAQEVVGLLVTELEAAYPPERLRALIQQQGQEKSGD